MTQSMSPLEAHIGYWMRMVSNQVSYAFARRIEDHGVTVAEWVVLREMFKTAGKTAPSAIAELTGLTRGAVSKLIERLLQKNLVTRKEAKDDRRYQEIQLTPKGRARVPTLARLADENDDAFFSVLTKAERKTLKDLLKKIAQAHRFHTPPIA